MCQKRDKYKRTLMILILVTHVLDQMVRRLGPVRRHCDDGRAADQNGAGVIATQSRVGLRVNGRF